MSTDHLTRNGGREKRRSRWKTACAIFLLSAGMGIAAPAQTFTTLISFNRNNGDVPYGTLVQGVDGNFYGTASGPGGPTSAGTVFKITSEGALSVIGTVGTTPVGLVLATDGNFYGTTELGGAHNRGAVFKITPAGQVTILHSFDITDGWLPLTALVQAADGKFYGTTYSGGANNICLSGCGTVFAITPAGALNTLHSFNMTDGEAPASALVQATNGNFYGTTLYGGAYSYGTVFKITPSGTLTTLHSFNMTDGAWPSGALVQATDGKLYGTTEIGGAYGSGTAFTITAGGALTTLYNFFSPGLGIGPYAGVIQATDGNFYGTTYTGGDVMPPCQNQGCGTIFQLTPAGVLTTLHSFQVSDGVSLVEGLVQATNGDLYGTTEYGGASTNCPYGCGTVFGLSMGLAAFVQTVPTSGSVGSHVRILGTALTGATSVIFNGKSAAFTVLSATQIATTVPLGATTGTVQVTTPGGTLSSNVVFRVP